MGMSKLFENTSRARCLKTSTYRFGCFACTLVLVGSLWDVLSMRSLQEVGGVGWVVGVLWFMGLSKLFWKRWQGSMLEPCDLQTDLAVLLVR